jgi:hypothetical protein
MAVFWVDPYINAPIGGIHGTLNGTTRNGTYSYPFSLNDILPEANTLSNTTINGVAIADNDEIRMKGLPLMNFMLDAGNNYYMASVNTIQRDTYSAAITDEFAGTNNCLVMAIINPPNTINNCVVLSNCAHATNGTTYNQLSVYSQSHMTGVFSAQYRNSSNKNFQAYLVKKQYYLTSAGLLGANQTIYFCTINRGITVTDGWTSETVRDGVNILCLGTTQGQYRQIYFNNNQSAASAGSDTLFDMPNTSIVTYPSNNGLGGNAVLMILNSCTKPTGINIGNTKTQKFGNIYRIDQGYGNSTCNFWAAHSQVNGQGSVDLGCNNWEVNAVGAYFSIYPAGQFGRNVTGTTRNTTMYYQWPYSWNVYDNGTNIPRTLKFGSLCASQADSIAWLYLQNTNNSLTIELLSNSTIYSGYGGAGAYLTYTASGSGPSFVFGTNIQSRNTATTLGPNVSNVSQSNSGPFVLKGISNTTSAYTGSVNMNTAAVPFFYEIEAVAFPNSNLFTHTATNSYGVLNTVGVDYKNTNHNVFTNYANNISPFGAVNTNNNNFHFSTNTFDQTPIGVMAPSNRNNSWNRGIFYYNDPAKTGALCFQSNGYAVQETYQKTFEVEIPFYTTQAVKIEFDLETSANWNTNITVNVFYVNNLGVFTPVTAYSNSSAVTTKTTYSTTISNASLSTSKLRHMAVKVTFTNGDTFTKKLWLHDVRVVLV